MYKANTQTANMLRKVPRSPSHALDLILARGSGTFVLGLYGTPKLILEPIWLYE